MIPSNGRSVAAWSEQGAELQLGPPQRVGTVRRLVLLSVERSVRSAGLSLRQRRRDTGDLMPDQTDGLWRALDVTAGLCIRAVASRKPPPVRLG
jgi:hypothetical protein